MKDIYVLDGLNGPIGMLQSFESSIWTVQFYGKNDFQIITAATDENLNLLQSGRYLVRDVDMDNGTFKNVMIIENIKLDFDAEKGWVLTVTGKGLKNIVGRRVIWLQTTISGMVEDGIRHVINENIINPTDPNRKIDNFTMEPKVGYTDTMDIQALGDNIADWLETTCETFNFGWDVYIQNGQYVFTLYKGIDRSYDQDVVIPVIFSPEYDNLLSSSYTYDKSEYKNAALIGGEGEGSAQRTASIGTMSGLDRFETYIDGSSVSSNGEIITLDTYLKMLEDYGKTQLAEVSKPEKFEGEIIPNGMYNINEDFFLGDIVQITNDKGISAISRIIEIIYSEDENGSSVVPTFKEWEVN